MGSTTRWTEAFEARCGVAPQALVELRALQVLARSRTTQTAVVEVPGVGRVIRKSWWWPTARDRFKGALRTTWAAPSPAVREFDGLERLCGLPRGGFAPAPLAVVEDRNAGVLRGCTLLLTEIEGATDLGTWLRDQRDPALRRKVVEDLARRTAAMHDAGLLDRDHHPRNVLVMEREGRTFKVDCPRQRARGAPLPDRLAALDLGTLDVGLVRLATTRERMRFARAYAAARSAGAGPRLCALALRARHATDARESRRLPGSNSVAAGPTPPDNDRSRHPASGD